MCGRSLRQRPLGWEIHIFFLVGCLALYSKADLELTFVTILLPQLSQMTVITDQVCAVIPCFGDIAVYLFASLSLGLEMALRLSILPHFE